MAVLRDLSSNREYPLRGKITLLGRDPTCDIVVSTERTSWRHALLFYTAQGHAIEDLDSVNGTFINGKRIQQRTSLKPKDRIEIPGLVVTFFDDAPATPSPGANRPEGGHLGGGSPQTPFRGDSLGEGGALQGSMGSDSLSQLPEPPDSALFPDLDKLGNMQAPIETDDLPILTSLEVGGVGRLEVRPEAKLRAVLEISQALGNTEQLNETLPRVLDRLFSIFPHADRGFILLRESDAGPFSCKAMRNRLPGASGEVPLSQGILNHALTCGRAILSADALHDERFDPYQSIQRFRIGSIMCVPIISQSGERFGIIQIDSRDKRHPFCEEDLEVLISATTMTARAVELSRWQREQSDLAAAMRIQKSFLPSHRPAVPGLEFFDYYASARLIGGDYYDYIPLPGRRLAVALGDVSGKGISAALLMARLSAAVRFSLATEPSVAEAVRCLNLLMLQVGAERFITFVVAVIDLNDYSMTLVNAGHPPPLLRRREAVAGNLSPAMHSLSEIGEGQVGLPLGIVDRPYEEFHLTLELGDTLVIYTDGITEARSPTDDFYGTDRLRALVESAPEGAAPPGELILNDVRRFAAGRAQSDDLTLVCLARQ